tara:strand:+ start:991 stop:1710 length:720 start_codon:yes stop_codon:yes gene_type:complete
LKYINRLLYAICISLFLGLTIKYLIWREPFKITHIIIKGNDYISNESINTAINEEVKNNSIININYKKIKNILFENNFIDKVKIYSNSSSSIVIELTEITPIGLLEYNEKLYFLNQDLEFVEAYYKSINHFYNTPVITNLGEDSLNLQKTKNILKKIMSHKDIYNKLNEIKFLNENIILVLDNYTEIILSNEEYNDSINKFIQFNNQIIVKKNTSIEDYRYINVSIPHQVIINQNKLKI